VTSRGLEYAVNTCKDQDRWLTGLRGKKGFKDVQFAKYGEMSWFKRWSFLGAFERCPISNESDGN
jgi:hypothetical protein